MTCTVYYAPKTTEERLLAYRQLEQQQVADAPASESAEGGEAEAISVLAEGSTLPSSQKLRFLFGILKKSRNAAAIRKGHSEEKLWRTPAFRKRNSEEESSNATAIRTRNSKANFLKTDRIDFS